MESSVKLLEIVCMSDGVVRRVPDSTSLKEAERERDNRRSFHVQAVLLHAKQSAKFFRMEPGLGTDQAELVYNLHEQEIWEENKWIIDSFNVEAALRHVTYVTTANERLWPECYNAALSAKADIEAEDALIVELSAEEAGNDEFWEELMGASQRL